MFKDSRRRLFEIEKREEFQPFKVSKLKAKKERKKILKQSAGPGWFNMKPMEQTPEVKRDIQLLKLRQSIDPSVHYKKLDWDKKFFQIGTVVNTPFDHYDNISKKSRKNNLIDQLIDNEKARSKIKKKYLDIQKKRASIKRVGFKRSKKRHGNKK